MAQKEDQYKVDNIVLKFLATNEKIENSIEFAKQNNIEHKVLEKVIKSLSSIYYINSTSTEIIGWAATKEGLEVIKSGTPEFQVFQAIPEEGISQDGLNQKFGKDFMKFAFGNGNKKKLFALDKETKLVKRLQQDPKDSEQEQLQLVQQGKEISKKDSDYLKTRKFIVKANTVFFVVQKGEQYQAERVAEQAEITSQMIKAKDWQNQKLKPFKWEALGLDIETGNMHPLQKVKRQFKEVLLELGFEEMPTNNYVESCFWNFDTLFVPQKHPARDLQDTFYISEPSKAKIEEREYLERVKKVHEKGDYGSIGYNYEFSEEETSKLVFRTHTTAASARMLHKIAQEYKQSGEFKPRKVYSIDRVFRNEKLDATHLAEFHQIEGIIADKNVGLGHLMGIIEQFFNKIGIKKLLFKPTYNPYTEPSLEIYGFHPILKKMVEIGNSGVFRPEMLRPMGIPEDVQVLGWGLGLERPTMIQYGYSNIRELFGDKVDLKMVKKNPITCFK